MGLSFYCARGSQKTSPITKYVIKKLLASDRRLENTTQTSPPNVGTGVQKSSFIPPPTQFPTIVINVNMENKQENE